VSLKDFIESQSDISFYKIVDNIVYYSSIDKPDDFASNDSKFWGKLFDISYQKMENLENSTKSTEVWKSSYDNSFIPKDEMDEWLNNSISRIKKLIKKNCKVLEIGSGNGLIFNSIIDDVNKYVGTDISEKGLKLIGNSKKGILNKNKIELHQLDALNIDKLSYQKFDLIIINSVAQYFPGLDYMFNVIKKIKQYSGPNSHIFLGDIRSYELQKLFYFDVLKKKHPKIDNEDLKNRITQLEKRENETLYHSSLFKLLQKSLDFINSCNFELKDGVFNNELTLYRYDVTLLCNNKKETNLTISSFTWKQLKNPEIEITEKLKKLENNEVLEIINIPNIRFTSLEGEYNFLFNKNELTLGYLKSNSLSFFAELARTENCFIQTMYIEEDIFKFTVQFCKIQTFNTLNNIERIDIKELSNKFSKKKSLEDIKFEEKITTKFPKITLVKVSNFLLSK
jgi:2-polyprenyl-3-methyl-5-hydroxy-6-metoxy-1,4-benzoquinol methylase